MCFCECERVFCVWCVSVSEWCICGGVFVVCVCDVRVVCVCVCGAFGVCVWTVCGCVKLRTLACSSTFPANRPLTSMAPQHTEMSCVQKGHFRSTSLNIQFDLSLIVCKLSGKRTKMRGLHDSSGDDDRTQTNGIGLRDTFGSI